MSDQNAESNPANGESPVRLRDALRKARIEAADRTGVVVDLRDAEVARLEIYSIAALAKATRHGCGSTRWRTS